jgi:DNA-binding response OmpR family regulator
VKKERVQHFAFHFLLKNDLNRKEGEKNSPVVGSRDNGISFATSLLMKKKILVADDDPGLQDIFKIILERAGYEVEIKEDGKDILRKKFRIPDLFLIDKLLSGMDGLAVCEFLKMFSQTKNIPVIMISASPDIGILSQKAGADDYIEKPFDIYHLLKVIERHIVPVKEKELRTAFR